MGRASFDTMPSLQLQSMFQSGPLSSADLSKFTGGAGALPRASRGFDFPLPEPADHTAKLQSA